MTVPDPYEDPDEWDDNPLSPDDLDRDNVADDEEDDEGSY